MAQMLKSLASTIAIKALRPHIFSELSPVTPISDALKSMKDESIRDIKWHAESYAHDEGYETYVPYNELRLGDYETVNNFANEIKRQSSKLEGQP